MEANIINCFITLMCGHVWWWGVSSHNLMHQIESKQGELGFWTFGVIWANFSKCTSPQVRTMFVMGASWASFCKVITQVNDAFIYGGDLGQFFKNYTNTSQGNVCLHGVWFFNLNSMRFVKNEQKFKQCSNTQHHKN